MRKSLLLLAGFSCLLFSQQLQAQEWFKTNSNGGGFNFQFGYQAFDADKYFGNNPFFQIKERTQYEKLDDPGNKSIHRATYNKPSGTMLTAGFQGYGVFNSIILGGELQGGIGSATTGLQYDTVFVNRSSSATTASTTSRFIQSNAMLNIGFVALRKRGIIAYPMLGLGYGTSGIWLKSSSPNLRVYPQVTDVVSRDDRNLQNMIIWTGNFLMDFGLGFQYMLGASTEDRAKGFSLGFRVGYQMQLATDNIKVNFNKKGADSFLVSDMPALGNSGIYAKLMIGFGKIGEAR